MTYRIAIIPDAAMDGISLQIAQRTGDFVQVLRFASADATLVRPGEAMPLPSLSLPDDLGRALLDALAAHYGGTTGGLQQRADFEHERRRVDLLIDRLTKDRAA